MIQVWTGPYSWYYAYLVGPLQARCLNEKHKLHDLEPRDGKLYAKSLRLSPPKGSLIGSDVSLPDC